MHTPPLDDPLALALDSTTLRLRLEALVDMVLSVRRSVREPARQLAGYRRADQERFLKAVRDISQETVELAFNFCMFGLPGLEALQPGEWDDWVRHLLATYDEGGVLPAIVAMQKVQAYAEAARNARSDVRLDSIVAVLDRFVQGLNGRPLRLREGEAPHTDTENIFLPAVVSIFESTESNYRLYKAMAVHQWAQGWYGTWRMSVRDIVARFAEPERALAKFHALETLRLDACLARDLPGVHREMRALRAADAARLAQGPWVEAAERLAGPHARVEDSAALLEALYAEPGCPPPACYQGMLLPERTEAVIADRVRAQREEFQVLLAATTLTARRADAAPRDGDDSRLTARRIEAADMPDGFRMQLQLDGEAVAPAEDIQALLDSIVVDLGHLPADYLVPAGPGAYRKAHATAGDDSAAAEEAASFYDEWDIVRAQYRRQWCLLRERDVHPVHDDFVERTRHKYRGLLKHLYRTFEALRGEDRQLHRQPFGDGIDLDAVVESLADQHAGLEGGDRLFTKRRRVERDIAVIFLVDMSGSTKGWINDIERESLVLLCEALETLGDRYAIYGFSGFTHRRCELFRVKQFEEPYDRDVRARISGIRPQDYTRLGTFIRHATRRFGEVDARTRLLVTLSDGRPDDQDGYRGEYGIEDTRQALFEARYQGIHPYCITIDDEAMDYLPHMYGAANFTVINEVGKLPYKVSDIYRRITI